MAGIHDQARRDGREARARGEPRDSSPYLAGYAGWTGAVTPEAYWLMGWDDEDERLALEESRPRYVGEVEWRPVRRLRGAENASPRECGSAEWKRTGE